MSQTESGVEVLGPEEILRRAEAFSERIEKNLNPEIDPETGLRVDGADVHPEGCGCVECNFKRYGCESCAGMGGEGCTVEKCFLDNDEEGDDSE